MDFIHINFILILLNACAFDVVHIKQTPVQLEQGQISERSFELKKEVNISLGTGYSRTLKTGTKWDYVGMISHGDVFKTKDQILTIEASNIYEAYIVISSGKLVGFYLPVEKSFSPLNNQIELIMNEIVSQP